MKQAAHHRLKHVIRYDAYAIYEADDGSFIAEPDSPEDDFQVVSRDIKELCTALDAIEAYTPHRANDAPDWLKLHLAAPTEVVVLPSAVPAPTAGWVLRAPWRMDPDVIRLRHDVAPCNIDRMIETGRLWELMPNEIERRFMLGGMKTT